jgi:hypothetical protein
MADILAAELKGDGEEMAQFRAGDRVERAFLCWKQVFDMKKYCMLAAVLALLLLVQLLQLVQMSGIANGENVQKAVDLYRSVVPADNSTTGE